VDWGPACTATARSPRREKLDHFIVFLPGAPFFSFWVKEGKGDERRKEIWEGLL